MTCLLKCWVLFWMLLSYVQARPQELIQPKWNWEAVILSRNGPSTSTTPRPSTTWSTTTLRSFDVDPIVGRGQGIVEDARLVPRRQGGRSRDSNGGASGLSSSLILAIVSLTILKLS